MFLVILFLDDSGLAVIPENWIDPDGQHCVLWPPYKSTTRIMSAVKQQEVPGDKWKAYPYKEMYRCVSYDKARHKLTEAEAKSDLQTGTEEEVDEDNECRRSKRPRREREYYSDDEMAEKNSLVSEKQPSKTTSPITSSLPSPPAKVYVTTPKAKCTTSREHAGPSSPHVARDVRLFTMLEKIIAEQKDQRRMLNLIVNKLENVSSEDTTGGLPEGLSFPVTTQQELENLEEILQDRTTFSAVVTHLCMYGGHNLKQTVTRLLKETVGSRLAEKYNFLGKKGKRAFGSLKLTSVIYKCVQKNSCTKSATIKEFEDIVKEWLRGAKDRDGGRKKRFSGVPSETVEGASETGDCAVETGEGSQLSEPEEF